MQQRALAKLLLLPSLASGLVAFFAAAVILGSSAWSYISNNQLFYTYLFGPEGLRTFMWQHVDGTSNWQQFFLASPFGYYVLVGGVALLTGLAVFTLLQLLGGIFRGSVEVIEGALPGGSKLLGSARREILSKFLLRSLSIIGWAIYLAYFVSTILPFSMVLTQFGIDRLEVGDHSGAVAIVGSVLLLSTALHLHVIFMRMIALRPRLIGGEDDIIEAQAREGI